MTIAWIAASALAAAIVRASPARTAYEAALRVT
jgi:hypothetical protein